MKFAVVSTGKTLNAQVAARLESGKYLLIFTFGTTALEVMYNPLTMISGPAAGRMLGEYLGHEKVGKILTEKCKITILKSLDSTGIQVITGMSGTVRNIVKEFEKMCMSNTWVIPSEEIKA